jgi:hypothetical protein
VPDTDTSHAVLEELRELGRGDSVTAIRRLSGGMIANLWLIRYADGTSVVGKTLSGAAPGLLAAKWLGALRCAAPGTWRHHLLPGVHSLIALPSAVNPHYQRLDPDVAAAFPSLHAIAAARSGPGTVSVLKVANDIDFRNAATSPWRNSPAAPRQCRRPPCGRSA